MSARVAGDAAAAVVRQEHQLGLHSSPIQTDSTLARMISSEDMGNNTGDAAGDEANLRRSNTMDDVAPPDLGKSVIELDALFQQARDKLFQVFDETVRDIKRVVTQRAREDKRRWLEWKASVAAAYERASSVQRERVEKVSAEMDDMTKLLDDSRSDADSLRADNGRLRSEIDHLKASRVHDSHPSLVGEALAEGQAAPRADMTEAVVAALPELRVSSPMIALPPLCVNTPSVPISTLARTPASRISLPSYHGELSPLPNIQFSADMLLTFSPSPDPLPTEAPVDAETTTSVFTFDAVPIASASSTGKNITSNVAQVHAEAVNDSEVQSDPSAECDYSMPETYVPTSSDPALGNIVQLASTTSPGLHTEHPAWVAAVSPAKSPVFAEASPVSRDTLSARAELSLGWTALPTGRSDTRPASAIDVFTAKVAPAATVASSVGQAASTSSSPRPPMVFGTGGRRAPLTLLSGNSPHPSPTSTFRSSSDAAASLRGRRMSTGYIDDKSGKASAREINEVFSRKSVSVRSVSIGAAKGTTSNGYGGGGGSSIALGQVREEATPVAAIGNVEDGKATRALGPRGCGYGTSAVPQGAGVGKDGVAKSQHGSAPPARASRGKFQGEGKPMAGKPEAGAAPKKIAEKKSAGTLATGKQKLSAGSRDDGVSSRLRSKAKVAKEGSTRGSSCRSATLEKATPSSTYNLRSRGSKPPKASNDEAGKRKQFFVFR